MRIKNRSLILLFLVTNFCFGQNSEEGTECNNIILQRNHFIEGYRVDVLDEEDKNIETISRRSEELDKVLKNYHGYRDRMELNTTIATVALEIPRQIINAGLLVAAPGTGGASAILIPAVNKFYDYTTDWALEEVTEQGKKSVQRYLKTNLEKYSEQFGEQGLSELLSSETPEVFRSRLEERLQINLDERFDDLPEEDKKIAKAWQKEEIVNAYNDAFQAVNTVNAIQEDEIRANRDNIVSTAKFLKKYADNTTNAIIGISENQKRILANLKELDSRVDRNENDIDFMQTFLYSKMSPKEQLLALKQGQFFDDLPSDEREKMELKLEMLNDRIQFEESLGEYISTGSTLITIARNVGISGETLDFAEDVINTADVAFSAYQSLTSVPPNYLGAVSAVTGLFAKKSDPAADRHRQIMRKLDQIYTKLGVMDEKLDSILARQQDILENQAKLYNELINLGNTVQKNHYENMALLREVKREVLFNRRLISAEIQSKYDRCVSWNVTSDGLEQMVNTAENIYPSTARLRSRYVSRVDDVRECFDGLNRIKVQDRFNPSLFHIKSYQQFESEINVFLDSVYTPSLTILNLDDPMIRIPKENALGGLMFPVTNLEALNMKRSFNFEGWRNRYPSIHWASFEDLMKDYLSVAAIEKHVGLVLDFHYYDMILDKTNDFRPFDDESYNSSFVVSDRGLDRLDNSLRLVNVAIAQQSLLIGDNLIHVISDIFDAYSIDSANYRNSFDKCVSLIENNQILAQNFLLYRLKKEVKNHSGYDLSLKARPKDFGTRADFGLSQVLQFPWEFSYSDSIVVRDSGVQSKGWSVKVGRRFIKLPQALDIYEGNLVVTEELELLFRLKSRLIEEIMTYRIYDGLDLQSNKMLERLISIE